MERNTEQKVNKLKETNENLTQATLGNITLQHNSTTTQHDQWRDTMAGAFNKSPQGSDSLLQKSWPSPQLLAQGDAPVAQGSPA